MTLNSNEFMVGNYAYDNNGNPNKITGIGEDYLQFADNEKVYDIKPIKLTVAILKENRWKRNKVGSTEIYEVPHKYFAAQILPNDDGFILWVVKDGRFVTKYFHLIYLHQLQQFFMLAGWNELVNNFVFPQDMYKPVAKPKPMPKPVEKPEPVKIDTTINIDDLFPTVDVPEIKL